MKIASKIGLGVGLVTLLLITNSIIGYVGAGKLGNSLSFISGPAWNTANNTMDSVIGLQKQLMATQGILEAINTNSPKAQANKQLFEDAEAEVSNSIARLRESGSIPPAQLNQLTKQIDNNNSAQQKAIETHTLFLNSHHAMMANLDQLVEVMSYVEEVGDGAVEVLENNPNLAMSWQGGLQDKWQAADGAMEARINILSRLYYYQSVLNGTPLNKVKDKLATTFIELEESVQRFTATPSFRNATIPEGPSAGKPVATTLTNLIAEHNTLTAKALEYNVQLQKDKANLDQVAVALTRSLEQLEETSNNMIEKESSKASELIITIDSLIILSALIGLIVAIASAVITIRGVANPISNVVTSMRNISSGEGDLTVQLPVKGNDETAQLSQAFNQFVDKIRGTMQQVSNATRQLAQQSTELAGIANNHLSSAERQQSETDLVATAITEFSQTSEVVASNASQVAEANEEASKQTQHGQTVITGMVDRISKLSDDVSKSAEVINHLDQDAESIEKILDVIRSIAEQTNLLALNAAIEAARAGDQGRGFAVVADEVRELATRSQNSTEEINALIERLRADSQNAVEVMSHSRQQAATTMEQTAVVNETFIAITDAVGKANDLASQIASAALQQSSVAEEVTCNVVNIKDLSSDNREGTEQIAETSQTLNDLTNQLQRLVGSFKI